MFEMKKVFTALALLLLSAATALYGDTTAQLVIRGTVAAQPAVLSLSVTPAETATSLDFTITSYGQAVGTLVASNGGTSTAYNVFVTSANSFRLTQTAQSEYSVPYTLIVYGGSNFTSGSAGGLVQGPITWDNSWDMAVQIESPATSAFPSGDYIDTLTFTIEAN
jgi:hypothetical protein